MSVHDKDSPIPSVNERLGQLRPSRELLEYYRKKVAEFDNEHEEMSKKLDKYKGGYEDQHRMECELSQREQEIADLQKAISDLQVCVLQEREQVLRLYSENDRLKIREVGDRKRIQQLIAIAGPAAAEVSYFHKEPPAKINIPQKEPKSRHPHEEDQPVKHKSSRAAKRVTINEKKSPRPASDDNQTLALQVEALQAQLEEQTRLARDQVNSLLEERRIQQEEADLQRERDHDRCERYAARLRDTQNLLYESTQDILSLKQVHRNEEKRWMAEKDKLLQDMDVLRDQADLAQRRSDDPKRPQLSAFSIAQACVTDYESRQQLEAEIKTLEQQLEQAGKLADMYREQCIQAEDELGRVREETEVHRDIFKERSEKIAKRLELMTVRYAALEKRRVSEVEGFKTDVKNLRKRLKDVEKQLYKVTVGGPVSDTHILQTVHATAGRSRAIQNELKTLKTKLYHLEGDLRGIY
ncbi:coiled-coil domain-containing protein 77-like [Clavelina lepadiformis]|uniref:coiled-coil domain-containing protein 77-like n=1 Tax=Clavelina lepadiformis TaxID=159417 RepID=UPI0040433334